MASILRQIVAGPRARHPETGLDLCYVTDQIIATSGPSQTYPQRAYRNPLDQLVEFLDSKHGDNWAIWEFRAEGTGYPDEAVYGRIRHYPWPDHHPPPFRLVPMIMASMRNWLHGGPLEGGRAAQSPSRAGKTQPSARVAVVHCKAGKGRSGTVACSYLISEEAWKAEEALARFTERRMRRRFGAGVSIPSQLRWISYVDRWTRHGKKYVDHAIEIVEVHVWGLRNGVKVDIEGFVDNGRKIRVLHTFTKRERLVVEGGAPASGGIGQAMWEMAGYAAEKAPDSVELADGANIRHGDDQRPGSAPPADKTDPAGDLIQPRRRSGLGRKKARTTALGQGPPTSSDACAEEPADEAEPEPGGIAVILRPSEPTRVPNSDVNVSVERRNKTRKSMGLTMVTAVAHVWFNAFFEGRDPEQAGRPDDSGVFAIDWDAMDGIKGSSRKGARALDRLAVVWRAVPASAAVAEVIVVPPEGAPVPQLPAADWTGTGRNGGGIGDCNSAAAAAKLAREEPDLGLRVQSPASADISRASSLGSLRAVSPPPEPRSHDGDDDDASIKGVRSSGPAGEELPGAAPPSGR